MRHAFVLLAMVAAVLVAYAPAYRAGFIWDDDLHVTANPAIVGPLGLREIWTTPAANYFPLTMTSFWLLHATWGLQPLPYHVVNVMFHAAAAVLLWFVLRRLAVRGAALSAALWALHPVQVESVAWISELKNTQSAGFFLLAMWFYIRRLTDESDASGAFTIRPYRSINYAGALFAAVGAVLSKSSTVMLPVVLWLCAWWLQRRWSRRVLWELLPFFVLALLVSGWTIWEQKYSSGAAGADWSHSLAARVAIAGRVPWFYLGKLLFPAPLVFIYPRWHIDPANPLVYAPGLALLGLMVGLHLRAHASSPARAAFFALAAFVVLLFPVLGLFDVYFFRFSFVGDHFQYLASMAALAGAGAALASVGRSVRIAAAVAVMVACSVLTWRQARIYHSDLELFRATVAANPDAWMAHSNLSAALADAGRLEDAITHAQRALDLRPDYAEAGTNLGRAMTLSGRPAEAVPHLERAVRSQPDYADARTNLGIALAALNRNGEAIAAFETALRLKPGNAEAHQNLGQALGKAGRNAEAATHFAAAARLRPGDFRAEMNWGLALVATGRFAEAVPHLDRAVQLSPNSAEVHASYGRALAVTGRLEPAQARLREALRLDPNSADAHRNLGLILQHLGRADEAAEHLRAAQNLSR